MNVIDSSGWLEYLADASNAEAFAPLIEDSAEVLVPAIVVFEVGRRVWQQRGEEAAVEAMSLLRQHRVVPLDADIAARAVAAGMMHKLAMADSIILATAEAVGATVWSQDRDFEGVPGVRFLPKPDGGSDTP